MLHTSALAFAAEAAPPLPVDRLVTGKTVDEVAVLMPRLFNLCRAAQAAAVRLALDLPAAGADDLPAETLRDHVLRLAVVLPRHFGQPGLCLPQGWQAGGPALAQALFGAAGRMPGSNAELAGFLGSDAGIAPMLRQVGKLFLPGEAASNALPFVDAHSATNPDARVENSPAARLGPHPVLTAVETRLGRGPLWRVLARAYDLDAVLQGKPREAIRAAPGLAHVPATRGLYTVSAQTRGGVVTRFARVTPTDHLRAPGGVLEQSLARLPADRGGLVPLLLDVLDPCSPIRVREVASA